MYAKTTWVDASTPLCIDYLALSETQYDSAITIGEVIMYPSTITPTDFLPCDGSIYDGSSTTYSALFAVTSYQFGGAASSFNVPDLRGFFIAGWSGDVVPGFADYLTLGASIGSSDAILTGNHLPSHIHTIEYGQPMGGSGSIGSERSYGIDPNGSFTNLSTGGTAHPNVPPYLTITYYIRYR